MKVARPVLKERCIAVMRTSTLTVADFYKERHGKPPGKQLFKNTQSTAIPATDVDLLDEAINKVISITNGNLNKKG
ncbi:hypothetical protein Cri9333_4786 (plasmid) [Crinalium epipsammum PCC 9333]|uniref:Uncharacterized protein n=1 Tax=Crinalium epipsammum PCC 9333 TaxID=1173022 RepID=K9W6Z5_9CYAN|nr:hypothetical protein [Crinalium epipsammum]AFZ15559.1 hypothetical protein Cri9333_4786 [Crinalium epipsammum PCC 9333]